MAPDAKARRKLAYPKHAPKMAKWRRDHFERCLFHAARNRSRLQGLPFDIETSDIQVPEFCPVLGIRLERSGGLKNQALATLDRIVPSLGYVKGNVRVISWRANKLKCDATPAELEALYLDSLSYMSRKAG